MLGLIMADLADFGYLLRSVYNVPHRIGFVTGFVTALSV
jgi:hypothetical protein